MIVSERVARSINAGDRRDYYAAVDRELGRLDVFARASGVSGLVLLRQLLDEFEAANTFEQLCSSCGARSLQMFRGKHRRVRALCDVCAVGRKREQSLVSWHRNKDRYRPAGARADRRQDG